jgi:hypothetical protein
MKVIKSQNRKSSDWTQKFVEASQTKIASLSVEAGKVSCPLQGKTATTLNCELCQYCQGFELKASSMRETIKCSYKYDSNAQEEPADVREKFISQHVGDSEKSLEVDPTYFDSEFKVRKANNYTDEEALSMNSSRVVSSKDGDQEEYGTKMVTSKYNNSIFDSEALVKLNEAGIQAEEDAKNAKIAMAVERKERKSEWERDHKIDLGEIGYTPSTMTKNISGTFTAEGDDVKSRVASSNNPDISEYKFSLFDEDIEKKVSDIAEKTAGEKLADQSKQRTASIGRDQKSSDWEKVKQPTKVDGMASNFFQNLFAESADSRVEASVNEPAQEESVANADFGSAYDTFLNKIIGE